MRTGPPRPAPPLPRSRRGTCFAFLGVRACDLQAIAHPGPGASSAAARDRVYAAGARRVPRRGRLRRAGRDLLLRVDGHRARARLRLRPCADRAGGRGGHRFLVEVGTERGAEVLAELGRTARRRRPRRRGGAAVVGGGRRGWGGSSRPTTSATCCARNREHPRWDDVAARCLTCGNCTHGLPDLLLHHGRGRRPT